MKSEFDKWWEENGCSIVGIKSCSKWVWKAALEWVEQTGKKHYKSGFMVMDLFDDIRKELQYLNHNNNQPNNST